MKFLCESTGYLPEFNAGSECMQHAIFRWLIARGHTCKVICKKGYSLGNSLTLDGVEIHYSPADHVKEELYTEADWIFSYLEVSEAASIRARRLGKPLAHVLHFDWMANQFSLTAKKTQLLIFNSYWMWEKAGMPNVPTTILYPPVWPADYAVEENSKEYITLVNVNPNKGGQILYHLAEMMPEHKFLGVLGAYGEQVARTRENLTFLPHQQDMRAVYSQTKILLTLSKIETWGRVAIEAACSGIPTVSSQAVGLKESLGSAGIFTNRDNIHTIISATRSLQDPVVYAAAAEKALARASELHLAYEQQLLGMENYLERYIAGDISSFGRHKELEVSYTKSYIKEFSQRTGRPFILRDQANELEVFYNMNRNFSQEMCDFNLNLPRDGKVSKVIRTFPIGSKLKSPGDVVVLNSVETEGLTQKGFLLPF